jgi:hypothetical protein
MRACIVQGSQQIWVAALWYWGYTLNGVADNYVPPWYICIIVWPLAALSFVFAYLMLYGLPGECDTVVPKHRVLTREQSTTVKLHPKFPTSCRPCSGENWCSGSLRLKYCAITGSAEYVYREPPLHSMLMTPAAVWP